MDIQFEQLSDLEPPKKSPTDVDGFEHIGEPFENIQNVIMGFPTFSPAEDENLERIFQQWHDHYDPYEEHSS